MRLDMGHYDGEPFEPLPKGIDRCLGRSRPLGIPEFYNGTDSRISFLAGGTKISVPFYTVSEAQKAQFKALLKIWYTADINFQEYGVLSRTYMLEYLNYAEIQDFKKLTRAGVQTAALLEGSNLLPLSP